MKLSDTRIRALKPRDKVYRLADGHGLAIEVSPGGGKHWRYRYRWAGKATMLSLGAYPVVGLAEARQKLLELQRLTVAGIDPGQARRRPRDLQDDTDASRFAAVAKAWRADKAPQLKPKTVAKLDTILDGDLIPSLGKVSIATLATPEAVAALEKIGLRAPHMAQKAKSYLNQIVDYAIRKGLREDGRKLTLKGSVRLPKAKSVPAAVDKDDLRHVMKVVHAYPDKIVRAGLLLTRARSHP